MASGTSLSTIVPASRPTYIQDQRPEMRMEDGSIDRHEAKADTQTAHEGATGWMGWSQSAIACAAGLGQRQVGSGWRRREVGRVEGRSGFRAAGRTAGRGSRECLRVVVKPGEKTASC